MSEYDTATQEYLTYFKGPIYTSYSIEICLQVPLSAFYIYLAYQGLTYYRANSFNLSLLISNGFLMFFYSFATLFYIITVVRVV